MAPIRSRPDVERVRVFEQSALRVVADDLRRYAEHELIQQAVLDDHAEHRRPTLADDQAIWMTPADLPQIGQARARTGEDDELGFGRQALGFLLALRLIAQQSLVALGAHGPAAHHHGRRELPRAQQHLLVGGAGQLAHPPATVARPSTS